MPDLQKTKSERLENVMQMKSKHIIHMKAKFECLYKRRSLNVCTAVLEKVMQMKSEHLIHTKAKSESLICRR